jgi:hypothetical protein
MSSLSISAAWDESRDIFARDGGLITAVVLALLVLPQTIVGLITPAGSPITLTGRIVWIASGLIGLVGQLALARLVIGPSTSVGEAIARSARRFLPTLGAFLTLVLGLAILLVPVMVLVLMTGIVAAPVQGQVPPPSFVLLAFVVLLGSVLVSIKFSLVVPISAAEEPGPIEMLKRSWRMTAGNYWRLLAFILLVLVASVAVLIATRVVGLIAARAIGGAIAPLTLGALILALLESVASGAMTTLLGVMLARIYLQISGRGERQASVPSSGI